VIYRERCPLSEKVYQDTDTLRRRESLIKDGIHPLEWSAENPHSIAWDQRLSLSIRDLVLQFLDSGTDLFDFSRAYTSRLVSHLEQMPNSGEIFKRRAKGCSRVGIGKQITGEKGPRLGPIARAGQGFPEREISFDLSHAQRIINQLFTVWLGVENTPDFLRHASPFREFLFGQSSAVNQHNPLS
jgi:hypothetical protein